MKTQTDLELTVNPPCWEVSPVDLYEFLRQLPTLMPSDSVLCLEGVEASDVEKYLHKRTATLENETDQGFLRMRPKVFYMPITEDNLQELAILAEGYAEPEVCDHLRVYRNGKIILSWHDLPSDPFYLASEIDEVALKKFCDGLGCTYVLDTEPV